MQARDSNDQRPEEGHSDGRRDTERDTALPPDGVAHQEVSDMGNRTVCLSATIAGKGGAAA